MDKTPIDETVEKVLQTKSVGKAQQVMESESGIWLVGVISFIESALPIPIMTDPFMIAAIMLNRAQTATIVFVTTVSSVIGGVFAYFTVLLFLDVIERFVSPEVTFALASLSANYSDSALLVTLLGAITPIPYTTASWAVAFIGGNLAVFIIASAFGRGFRYALLGFLTYKFGPLAVKYGKRSIGVTTLIIFILLVLYIWHKM